MTQLTYDKATDTYQGTANGSLVEVEAWQYIATVAELSRSHYDHGMNWDEAHNRAVSELSWAEVWLLPSTEGVKITEGYSVKEFQSKIEELVSGGHITREPIFNQGIAVKYLKDEYQPIALAELDKQGK